MSFYGYRGSYGAPLRTLPQGYGQFDALPVYKGGDGEGATYAISRIFSSALKDRISKAGEVESLASAFLTHPMAATLNAKIAAAEKRIGEAHVDLNTDAQQYDLAWMAVANPMPGQDPVRDAELRNGVKESILANAAGKWTTKLMSLYNGYINDVSDEVAKIQKAVDAANTKQIAADTKSANVDQRSAATAAHETIQLHAAATQAQIAEKKLETTLGIGKVMKPILIGAAVLVPVGIIAAVMMRKKKGSVAGYRRRRSRR